MIKAFPFDKMIPVMLDPEMVEDTAKKRFRGRKRNSISLQYRRAWDPIYSPMEGIFSRLILKTLGFSQRVALLGT